MEPNPKSQQSPGAIDPPDASSRPTHQLEGVKVGDDGVQLLVSTKDHLYNAKNVEAGAKSWQVIGAWNDASVQELGKMINQRQTSLNRETSTAAGFGSYGTGYTLRAPGGANVGIVPPQRPE
ncbi:hypothetical protein BKA56DRAFT_679591 [Ilyonectria sp. MPI-CAGE-AT-0026]|nr:hypothetical protein BKA56DRAFT_679591 [Ilyonectria sp. MPI-CAGE-AT-0026]